MIKKVGLKCCIKLCVIVSQQKFIYSSIAGNYCSGKRSIYFVINMKIFLSFWKQTLNYVFTKFTSFWIANEESLQFQMSVFFRFLHYLFCWFTKIIIFFVTHNIRTISSNNDIYTYSTFLQWYFSPFALIAPASTVCGFECLIWCMTFALVNAVTNNENHKF